MKWIMTGLLVVGGFACCLNFYLSFLRYPIHRMMGKSKEEYQWVSGAPLLGSLFVAIGLIEFWQTKWLHVPAIVLILIDTGGLHWFAGTMIWHGLFKRENRSQTTPTSSSDAVHGESPDEM